MWHMAFAIAYTLAKSAKQSFTLNGFAVNKRGNVPRKSALCTAIYNNFMLCVCGNVVVGLVVVKLHCHFGSPWLVSITAYPLNIGVLFTYVNT